MGALHAGHAALFDQARRENNFVVASIFVNPLQFDQKQDLARYPRTLERDLELCAQHGVDLVFAPTASEIYPQEPLTFVDSPVLAEHLCGAHRPGHFRGVATVVLKLLNLVAPERAYFGEKDAQQLAIIRRMVSDLNVPVEIVGVPTVREDDGLALSSRNQLLTPDQRRIAPALYRALDAARSQLDSGERSADAIRSAARAVLAGEPEIKVEYFEVSDPETLQPLAEVTGHALVAAAVFLGTIRLIDNVLWTGLPHH
jgi:pantoate--beta-alanine ligase